MVFAAVLQIMTKHALSKLVLNRYGQIGIDLTEKIARVGNPYKDASAFKVNVTLSDTHMCASLASLQCHI